jgi:imidazolonepropionase-like amidohydrolase
MPGISLHHELELLVSIGLTRREALAAATSNFAAIYGWKEIGCLAAGCRADVLVLDADPTADLANLRKISALWLAGEPIDRQGLLEARP